MPAAEHNAAVTPLRQRLGRAGGSLRPRAAGFWAWWTHALASWLPLRLRELFGLARERLLLVAAPGSMPGSSSRRARIAVGSTPSACSTSALA